MSQDDLFHSVDRYITDLFVPSDSALSAALADSDAAGLPQINVSAPQGKLLMLLARMCGARRVLEIGTLGGYSTIWLARALPADGQLISLELQEEHAAVARANLARAGVGAQVEVRVGPAVVTLAQMIQQQAAPFDLIFIDADKPSYPEYLRMALALARPGTVIIADNVVRKGAILEQDNADPNVQGARAFNQALAQAAAQHELDAVIVQTVGGKGYDGMAIALVGG
jgi:predicted O-methyltransferase YrrM